MKSQLRLAGHLLDDAESVLREAGKASLNEVDRWHAFANFSIQHACQIANTIYESVQKYGGPDNVTEVG